MVCDCDGVKVIDLFNKFGIVIVNTCDGVINEIVLYIVILGCDIVWFGFLL